MKLLSNSAKSLLVLAVSLAAITATPTQAKQTLVFESTAEDMTPIIRDALDNVTDDEIKLVFKKGHYQFSPEYALSRYSAVTNHGNGVKKVIFPLDNFKSVEIEGGDSEFIFHGQTAPFQLYNNQQIKVTNLTIDWDIPFTFVAEVLAVNKKQAYRDVKPWVGTHSWKLKDGKILFPNIDGFNYDYMGSTLAFEKDQKKVVHGGFDRHSKPTKVEDRGNGVLRLHEKLKHYPPVGSLTSSKGDRHSDRYAPAFQVKNSKNVVFDNVTIHHALGMGFLFERTENIKILNSGVHLRDGAQRLISSTADATHFANCKGDILVENSRFENMLDDGTNVHGTYTIVDKIIDNKTVRVKFGHFEQTGFEFAGKGDDIWFVHQPNVGRAGVATVDKVRVLNEMYTEISFTQALPKGLKQGDLLENKTWNPTFTMRGNVIRDHRARNIVIKTPLKIVIEDNHLSSMMSSILFRGETFFWFESGIVEDVTIRNNVFEDFAYAGKEHAALYITPRLGKTFDQTQAFDKNIRFENNTIKTFGTRIVWADRVDGLLIQNNTIEQSVDKPVIHPNRPLFEFMHSNNVELKNNRYEGDFSIAVKADKHSQKTLKDDGSIAK
ncbi:alpha-1,3-galactosidase-related protein [Paraglaciecola sp.]|uniref:alpha-1,3-galactosidase-related protein n=1 Tax=Paraglaciecola sp. TaxID=1920173 RepID=UPI003EFA0A1E